MFFHFSFDLRTEMAAHKFTEIIFGRVADQFGALTTSRAML